MTVAKPTRKPANPSLSSGPCKKRPGWSPDALSNAVVGRSHRGKPGKARIVQAMRESRELLGLPDDYLIGIIPASDTGAVECALWSMLGARPVDVLVWESFSKGWATDINSQLKLDANVYTADYGQLPDLGQVDWTHDVVFAWNGTTSGVRVPNGDWIADDREGLSICDATSAAFAMDIPWSKIDVLTYSWQKCLGGEAAHGVMVLSSRAVERLNSYQPTWPMPKIFRMTKKGEFQTAIFEGSTINTPSLLCVEDYLDALAHAREMGGLEGLIAASERNLSIVEKWVDSTPAFEFLAADKSIRSCTSVCVNIVNPIFTQQSPEDQTAAIKKICAILEAEDAVYDVASYRDAPPGFRFWCGPFVQGDDLELALEWVSWACTRI